MQPETIPKLDPDAPTAESKQAGNPEGTGNTQARSNSKATNGNQNGATNGQFPPPKTDKPRPHVCATCGRSFARLEHLKRHERSHTKEKPFECPECTRCFARRDLLLRHQQKLHLSNPPSSRPRSGRRESVSGASNAGNSKVRKNSMANAHVGGLGMGHSRPRANTISHIDLASLGILDGTSQAHQRMNALGLHAVGMNGLGGPVGFDYRGMSNAMGNHGNLHGLPKLDISGINNYDISNSLRTAPPMGSFQQSVPELDLDQLFSPSTTVNPAQLHASPSVNGSAVNVGNGMATHLSLEMYNSVQSTLPGENEFGWWMREWHPQGQSGNNGNEQAVEESSPSRISSGESPADYDESLSNSNTQSQMLGTNFQWGQQDSMSHQAMATGGPFQLDALNNGLPRLDAAASTMSPSALHDPTVTAGTYFDGSMMQDSMQPPHHQPHMDAGHQQGGPQGHPFFAPPSLSGFSSDSPSMSASSMTSSVRQSSVSSYSTDSITDVTRQALLTSLAQPSVFGHNHRKYSQPNISSPLSPDAARTSVSGPALPSTTDMRRYVEAFQHFAHSHLPIVHLPTLTFDTAEYCSSIRGPGNQGGLPQSAITGGGGCLILAMAAIGALYEYDHPASKELHEAAKKMIQLYLEERRKAGVSAAVNGAKDGHDNAAGHTPLWLVHAMLLNVIYGHQCGDKIAADIASNQCAALVSLARAAGLAQSPGDGTSPSEQRNNDQQESPDVHMSDANASHGFENGQRPREIDLQTQWLEWKTSEEKKRSLFAIFIISSLLTTAYNQTPTIMNSEITLDLPCDEELFTAETAQEWQNRGGMAAVEANTISFASALSTLLTANQRLGHIYAPNAYNINNPLGSLQSGDQYTEPELRPSTYGCQVLINALHNYIWETRSRHHGRQWTQQETDSMFSHIEPALNAWQAAWKANPHHKLERPNPFGLGPLAADSIPLLDLAFLRLFVNMGRSKEAFWRRDFDAMADELARGSELAQHADDELAASRDVKATSGSPAASAQRRKSQAQLADQASSRRERHLRKAAFYAADSFTISCSFNLTYTDMTAHELPIQSSMCFFDCSQVLAEWASTVQERVGRYLGVLGRDVIDYTQVPAIMLLETEDVELLRKIDTICESLEAKRFQQENLLQMDLQQMNPNAAMNGLGNGVNLNACGYGSKILRVTAMMLEKAVVWPVTHVMAKALETQAAHMDQRAQNSCTQ